jgi:gamma-glutamyltranspeptidase
MEVVSDRGVVSCGHIREAEAGARIIEEGANVVDAAVAAAFTGYVVEPANCGLGGYGHLALFLAEARQLVSVDHQVRAPAAARSDMFGVDLNQAKTYYGWPRRLTVPMNGGRARWQSRAPLPGCAPPMDDGAGFRSPRCSNPPSRRPRPAYL